MREATPHKVFLAGIPQIYSGVHPLYGAPPQPVTSQPKWLIVTGLSQMWRLSTPASDEFQNSHETRTWRTGPNGREACWGLQGKQHPLPCLSPTHGALNYCRRLLTVWRDITDMPALAEHREETVTEKRNEGDMVTLLHR